MISSPISTASDEPTADGDSTCPVSEELGLSAAYVRISINDPSGTEDQFAITSQRAAKDGYPIPPGDELFQYVDNDATGKNSNRRALQRLQDLMFEIATSNGTQKSPFQRLYVKDRTRLGRWNDPREHNFLEILCKRAGVTVCYCDEEIISYDDDDAGDITGHFLLAQVANLAASKERKKIVTRTREGSRSAAAAGRPPYSITPYGIEKWLTDKRTGVDIEIVPRGRRIQRDGCGYTAKWAKDGTIDIVAETFRRFESGETMSAIARDLNERGIKSPGAVCVRHGKNSSWTGEAVRKILDKPIYVGDLIWGRKNAHFPAGVMPKGNVAVQSQAPIVKVGFLDHAPVSRQRWDNVQRMLDSNSAGHRQRRANKAEFALSSILQCAACGAPLYGFTKTEKSGRIRRYYRHDKPRRHKRSVHCAVGNRYLRADEVEPVIQNIIEGVLSDESLLARANEELRSRLSASAEQRRQQEIDAMRKTRDDLERAKKQAARDRSSATSETVRATYGEVVEDLSRERNQLDTRILAAEKAQALRSRVLKNLESTIAGYADCYQRYLSHDARKRKEVVREVCEAIIVNPDTRVIEVRVRAA